MLDISTGQWLAVTAAAGIVATCWGKFRAAFTYVSSFLIVRARLEGSTNSALLRWLWKHARRTRYGTRRYDAVNEFVQPADRYQIVGFEQVGTKTVLFWVGWKPLLLHYEFPSSSIHGGPQASFSLGLEVSFLRGSFDLDTLLVQALNELNDENHHGQEHGGRFLVHHRFGHGRPCMGRATATEAPPSPEANDPAKDIETRCRRYLQYEFNQLGMPRGDADPFEALAFPAEVLSVLEEVRRWKASEAWYKEKRIPWRRGFLLWGAPGSGKTSLVRAIAKDVDVPIVSFDLSSYGNEDFCAAWQRLLTQTPCMALLEDVDGVFEGRQNRLGDQGGGLSFDCLLNCISGVTEANGLLLFITTNKIDDLDAALGKPSVNDAAMSTRPGRVDRAVYIGALDEACREKIARRILTDCPERIEETVAAGINEMGAQFQERCSQIALEHYWTEERDKTCAPTLKHPQRCVADNWEPTLHEVAQLRKRGLKVPGERRI